MKARWSPRMNRNERERRKHMGVRVLQWIESQGVVFYYGKAHFPSAQKAEHIQASHKEAVRVSRSKSERDFLTILPLSP